MHTGRSWRAEWGCVEGEHVELGCTRFEFDPADFALSQVLNGYRIALFNAAHEVDQLLIGSPGILGAQRLTVDRGDDIAGAQPAFTRRTAGRDPEDADTLDRPVAVITDRYAESRPPFTEHFDVTLDSANLWQAFAGQRCDLAGCFGHARLGLGKPSLHLGFPGFDFESLGNDCGFARLLVALRESRTHEKAQRRNQQHRLYEFHLSHLLDQ